MHQAGDCAWERREGLLGRLGHQEMHRGLCRGRREGLQGHLGLLGMHRGLCQNLQRAKCLGMRQKLGRCCCLGCCLGTRQILG